MTDHPDLASAARDAYDVLAAWTDDEAVQRTRQALRAALSDRRPPRRIQGYDGSRVDCYHWYGDEGEPCGDACRLLDPPPGEDPWDVSDTPEPPRSHHEKIREEWGQEMADLVATPEGGQPTDDELLARAERRFIHITGLLNKRNDQVINLIEKVEQLERERDEVRDHCPHVVTSDDGTSYCGLAEARSHGEVLAAHTTNLGAVKGLPLAPGWSVINRAIPVPPGTRVVVRADQETTDGT